MIGCKGRPFLALLAAPGRPLPGGSGALALMPAERRCLVRLRPVEAVARQAPALVIERQERGLFAVLSCRLASAGPAFLLSSSALQRAPLPRILGPVVLPSRCTCWPRRLLLDLRHEGGGDDD